MAAAHTWRRLTRTMSSGSARTRWELAPGALLGSALLAGCALLPGGDSDATPVSPSTAPTVATSAPSAPALTPLPTDGPGMPSVSISGFPSQAPSPTRTPTPTATATAKDAPRASR